MARLKEQPSAKIKHGFWANVVYYKTLHNVDDDKLINLMGVSRSTFYRRKKNIGTITLDEIISMSNALHVPIENLMKGVKSYDNG